MADFVGDARRADDVARAADLIASGRTIGFFNRSVCALLGSGDTRAFPDEVIRVKGEKRRTRPVGCIVPSRFMAESADATRVPAAISALVSDAAALRARLAGVSFLRLPFRAQASARIPEHLLSRRPDGTAVLMGCDPSGYAPLHDIMEAVMARGVKILAGTSMNPSGSPEITDQQAGIDFARSVGLPMFLGDSASQGGLRGSPSVLACDADAVRLIRDSYVPPSVLEPLIGCPILRSDDTREPRQDYLAFDGAAGGEPGALCNRILAELDRLT